MRHGLACTAMFTNGCLNWLGKTKPWNYSRLLFLYYGRAERLLNLDIGKRTPYLIPMTNHQLVV